MPIKHYGIGDVFAYKRLSCSDVLVGMELDDTFAPGFTTCYGNLGQDGFSKISIIFVVKRESASQRGSGVDDGFSIVQNADAP